MGLSGVSGPFRGAYVMTQCSTGSLGLGSGAGERMWSWTVPTGMDIEIVDIQAWCASASTNTRINVLAGGASILQNGDNSETANGVGLTNGQTANTAASVTCTPSLGIFGTTATSIIAPATPSVPGSILNRGRSYGAYVVGGASLSCTVSNLASPYAVPTGAITVSLLWFPRSHPAALRSSFE